MQECIPDSDYQQLHHFISESNWDAFGVMRTVAAQTQQSLSGLKGQQGLLLDESGWEKAGTKSVGVARQYIGQVGKVCNAQVGVFAALVRGERVGIVNARLYLPAGWSTDQPRCKAAGIPTAHQVYQTKAELAVSMLTELKGLVTYDWVGGRQHLWQFTDATRPLIGPKTGVCIGCRPRIRGVLPRPGSLPASPTSGPGSQANPLTNRPKTS